jgi:hypothetical protein
MQCVGPFPPAKVIRCSLVNCHGTGTLMPVPFFWCTSSAAVFKSLLTFYLISHPLGYVLHCRNPGWRRAWFVILRPAIIPRRMENRYRLRRFRGRGTRPLVTPMRTKRVLSIRPDQRLSYNVRKGLTCGETQTL